MLESAYRIIKTLEKNLALYIKVLDGCGVGKSGFCPFCKASRFKEVKKHWTRKDGTTGTQHKIVLDHAKDCEVIRLLDEMEEWGCR